MSPRVPRPCPFCAAPAAPARGISAVWCPSCGAIGPVCRDLIAAADAWDRRPRAPTKSAKGRVLR